MITLAVLGGSGFIGGRLVEMLVLNDLAGVRPVVRSYSSLARLSRFSMDSRVADAFDQKALACAFEGCDVVVHAVAGDRRTIVGTLVPVYQAAQEAGVSRLVYLSTASVHGQAPEPGTDESTALRDRQGLAYNNAKVKAESILRDLRSRGEVELVVLRPGIVFGPRSSWVIRFADDLLAGKAYLLDRGEGVCNSVYVDNLVHAVYLAATQPAADREVFLVGDEERVTWADLYRPITAALGYDLREIPEGRLPERNGEWHRRFERIRTSKPARSMLSVLPSKIRRAASRSYRKLLNPQREAPSPATLSCPPRPEATTEMALLYRCRYRLPHDKAKRCLGYRPVVPFDEACLRTVAWLAYAGYPVVSREPIDRGRAPE